MGIPQSRKLKISYFRDIDYKIEIPANTTFKKLKKIAIEKFSIALNKEIKKDEVEILDNDFYPFDPNQVVFENDTVIKDGKVYIEQKEYIRKRV